MLGSALLCALYARGGGAFLLGFVMLVPWLLALDGIPRLAHGAVAGVAMAVAFVAAVFWWFADAVGAYTGIGTTGGLLALLVAAPLLQPQFVAFALVRVLAGRRHGVALRALAAGSAWVATEWLVPRLFGDTLGHGLQPSRLLRQFAEVGGAPGLTLVLLFANEAIAHAIGRRRDGARAVLAALGAALALPLLLTAYGGLRVSQLAAQHDDMAPLRVGMVQANLADYEARRRAVGAYAVVREVLDTHVALSREALAAGPVDALLWSETVYPTTYGQPKSAAGADFDREIAGFVDAAGVPLVLGTYDRDAAGEYNAAAFLVPHAGTLGFYRKTRLFPLTERVPAWLDGPALRRAAPWAGTWRAGDGARVFPLRVADGREVPVLPLICLDDTDARLGIDGARLGAQAIVTLSNDAWFSAHAAGARLHLAVAAFRSIETRLPQVRVTTTGISAAIDASGEVIAATAVGERRTLVATITPREAALTPMVRWGDWIGPAALAVLFVLALAAFAQRRPMHAPARSEKRDDAATNLLAEHAALPRGWRGAEFALRIVSWCVLAWIAVALLWPDVAPLGALARLRAFVAGVVAPTLAAWAIRRAFGVSPRATAHPFLGHPLVKFALFPLLPAIPAFRLHQHIAFGGTFGEYYTYGLQAYLLAFALWWAAWAIGLTLLAAGLRLTIETTVLAASARSGQVSGLRTWSERTGLFVFYVGVPAWLVLRLLAG